MFTKKMVNPIRIPESDCRIATSAVSHVCPRFYLAAMNRGADFVSKLYLSLFVACQAQQQARMINTVRSREFFPRYAKVRFTSRFV
jgi:hypothetical protein